MISLTCRPSAEYDIIANYKITIFFNKSKFTVKTTFAVTFRI